MRSYNNYFDDDENSIESLVSSFDGSREAKKEEVNQSLKEIEAANRVAKSQAARAQKVKSEEALNAPKKRPEKPEKSEKPVKSDKGKKQKPENRFEPTPVIERIKSFVVYESKKIAAVARDIKEKGVGEEFDHLSKKKKTRVTIGLVAVFLVFCVVLVGSTVLSVKNENKRIEKFNSDAGKVCAQYITKYGNCSYESLMNSYGINGYKMTGLCFVREIDFNNDNVGELMLCYDDGGVYFTEVWGYNEDNDFVAFYHKEATQTDNKRDDAFTTLYFKNNKCYIGEHSGDGNTKVALYELDGSSFKKTKMTATYTRDGANYSVDGKNRSSNFERIRLSVLVEEKAALNSEKITKLVEKYLGSTSTSDLVASANNMQSAYYSIVLDYNQKYGKAEYIKGSSTAFIKGLAVVDLIDFNGDGTDELLLIYRRPIRARGVDSSGNYLPKDVDKYFIEIYRYNGTKAILSYKNEGISNSLSDDVDRYYIIKRKNNKAYYCFNAFASQDYGRTINANSTIYKFSKGKFTAQTMCTYSTNYGYTTYYIDGTQVYAATFDQKGYTVPLFNGKNKYDKDTFTVTYLQRKRLKAENMDERVEDTINNIKKLNSSYSGKLE